MTPDKTTIGKFVEENDKLFTVLGIFLGIATIANNTQIKIVGQSIAFICLYIALLIWSEIFIRSKSCKPTGRLILFLTNLLLAFIVITLYWLIEFLPFMRFLLAV